MEIFRFTNVPTEDKFELLVFRRLNGVKCVKCKQNLKYEDTII